MKIAKVEAFLMSYPMPEEIMLPFWGGIRRIVKRDAMLIRITADNGLKGYAPGPAFERALQDINNTIGPFLAGRDPLSWKTYGFSMGTEINKTYGAVEVAVIDLAARYESCALSELVGQRVRNKIKLYGSAGMYMSPEKYAEEAAAIKEMGFLGYKMRPALGPEEDLRTIALIRNATSNDMAIMIDAHTWWRMGDKSYTPATIHDLAAQMAQFHPYWLEEPLPPENHEAYKSLNDKRFITIATGEHEQDYAGFADLAEKQAAGFLQMDVCCQGGFEMGLRVFDLAHSHGLKFAFHCWGTDLEVLAAAHLGVCRDESVVEWLEYPCYSKDGKTGMYPFPIADEILKKPLNITDGYLEVPDGPGLGIEINEAVITKYPYIRGPWSFFHQDSPKTTIAVTGDHSLKWIES